MKNILFAALLLAACQSSTETDGWQKRVGVIHPEFSSTQMLTMPTELRVGEAFDVIVRTHGSSSCTRAANVDVDVSGARLSLTPYDEYAPVHLACTDDLMVFEHHARVTLHTVGVATVRVHGRNSQREPITYEMEVTVRP